MGWRLLVVSLLVASPAAADVVDEEVEHAECASGRALVVDHGRYDCLDEPSTGDGGCAARPGPVSGGLGWLAAASLLVVRRRRS